MDNVAHTTKHRIHLKTSLIPYTYMQQILLLTLFFIILNNASLEARTISIMGNDVTARYLVKKLSQENTVVWFKSGQVNDESYIKMKPQDKVLHALVDAYGVKGFDVQCM